MSRDFLPLFYFTIDSTWAQYEQAKMVSRTFSFTRRYSITKFEIRVSAESTTFNDFRGHRVSVVNDYTDTDKITLTRLENFDGFLQILKKQSGKKVTWVHYTPNSNNLKVRKSLKEKFTCPCSR